MNPRREAWAAEHGPIPKGWVIHAMNGDMRDLRPENLAAVPRSTDNINEAIAPYKVRIRKLELQLRKERENAAG